MVKSILAVLTGLVVGFITIYLVELVSQQVYPLPAEVNLQDPEAMGTYMANAPAASLVLVLLAYALGSFLGGMVAARLATTKKMVHAIVVGVLLLLAGIANFYLLPHPIWFVISAVIIYPLMSFFGGAMGSRDMP
jgi:MFS family permease